MKRTLSVLAAFLLLLGLTACNNNAAQKSNVEPQGSQKAEVSNDLSGETKTDSSDTVAEGTESVQGSASVPEHRSRTSKPGSRSSRYPQAAYELGKSIQ